MSDAKFINGLIVKAPNQNAPEYVKAKLSIKRAELMAWLAEQDGEWINADIKVSQGGKWYAAVDDWKPGERRDGETEREEAQRTGKPRHVVPQRGGPVPRRDETNFDDGGDAIPFLTNRGTW